MRAYDIEIEASRLHLVMSHDRTRAEADAAEQAYLDDTSNPFTKCEYRVKNLLYSEEEEKLGMLHWVQGRNVAAECPKETRLSGPLAAGVMAGELACFIACHDAPGRNPTAYFPQYIDYLVRGGWLVGVYQLKNGKNARHKLVEVPFKKVALVHHSPGSLTLKIIS